MSAAESQVSADSTRFQGEPEGSGPSRERLDRAAAPLTFAHFSEVNAERCGRWHPGFPEPDSAGWSGADWSNAMLGEVGEAAEVFALFVAAAGKAGNIVKKLRRSDCGLKGALDLPPDGLREKLAHEIADVICYADLLATYYGIDLGVAVSEKFNAVSELQGFPERLP